VAGLPPAIANKIVPRQAGVGVRNERIAFSATGDMGAAIDDRGDCMIETVALHELVEPGQRSVFIKYDVEGAEGDALAGTEPLIRADAPSLAVSIYHRPEDLWKIPSDLHAMNPGYRLFLRTLGHDGMDVICYAVAPHAVRTGFHAAPDKVA
jgi:hypothetical protein